MFAAPLGGRPDPVRDGAARDDDDDYDDEDDEERPRHPYTWLHLIVLALVAFVLGFLIVLLLGNTTDDDPGSTAAVSVTHSTTGLSAGPV
ncbi:hypothetical protein [Cellulomonas sp.]|uniref:hypothetical protein n=1 Tax=Cellulomonas sp. TaxID=40001 RepID=UPI003BA936F2